MEHCRDCDAALDGLNLDHDSELCGPCHTARIVRSTDAEPEDL